MTQIIFLATLNKLLIDYFAKPLKAKYPNITVWLPYVAMLTGGVIGWLSGSNVFAGMFAEVVGRLLTAVLIGGGSGLIHDVFQAVK